MMFAIFPLACEEAANGMSPAEAERYAELFLPVLNKAKYVEGKDLIAQSVKTAYGAIESNPNSHFAIRTRFRKDMDQYRQAERNFLALMGSDNADDRARSAKIMSLVSDTALPPDPAAWRAFIEHQRKPE